MPQFVSSDGGRVRRRVRGTVRQPARPSPALLLVLVAAALSLAPTALAAQNGRAPLFDPTADPTAELEAAVQEAMSSGRRIILDVGGNWCGWCFLLHDYFEAHEDLKAFRDDNFVWVLVNFGSENRNEAFLSQYPDIHAYPHLFVLERDGTFLHSQDTGVLEEGRGYNEERMWAFLREWAPMKE